MINETTFKINLFNLLLENTQNHNINSFKIIDSNKNSKEINTLNIRNLETKNFIQEVIKNINNYKFKLNSKNNKIFFKKYQELFIKKEISNYFIFNNMKKNICILKNGRIISFNISNHSFYRFIERIIIFYLVFGHKKNNVSEKFRNDAKYIIGLIKSHSLKRTDKKLNNIILSFINNSQILKEKSLYRFKDKMNFKRRKNIYNDENKVIKIINNPFMFIINTEKGILKTVELFSSSFPNIDYLNKIASKIENQTKTNKGKTNLNGFLIEVIKWSKYFKK